MQTEDLIKRLKSLKLYGMADAITVLAEQAAPAFQKALPLLMSLLDAEESERLVRSISYQMKVAKFPSYRDLVGFEFAQSMVDEALIKSLHRCEFMADAQNVVLVGGPGTGKTHLSTAIAVQAIQHHHYRIRFFSSIELVNMLELEKQAGKQGRLANRLLYADLVILDELGYLRKHQPFG
jgi:DNA replication protein DnaC